MAEISASGGKLDGYREFGSRLAASESERAQLRADNDRLRQDRYDALSVTSTDGLLSSEWVARTGAAERRTEAAESERDRIRAQLEAVRGLPEAWRNDTGKAEFELSKEDCADELEQALSTNKPSNSP